eukprot:3650863-Pleurochrysis_carterae.AAC.3
MSRYTTCVLSAGLESHHPTRADVCSPSFFGQRSLKRRPTFRKCGAQTRRPPLPCKPTLGHRHRPYTHANLALKHAELYESLVLSDTTRALAALQYAERAYTCAAFRT